MKCPKCSFSFSATREECPRCELKVSPWMRGRSRKLRRSKRAAKHQRRKAGTSEPALRENQARLKKDLNDLKQGLEELQEQSAQLPERLEESEPEELQNESLQPAAGAMQSKIHERMYLREKAQEPDEQPVSATVDEALEDKPEEAAAAEAPPSQSGEAQQPAAEEPVEAASEDSPAKQQDASEEKKPPEKPAARKRRISILPPEIQSYDEVKAEWDRLDEDARPGLVSVEGTFVKPIDINFEDLLARGSSFAPKAAVEASAEDTAAEESDEEAAQEASEDLAELVPAELSAAAVESDTPEQKKPAKSVGFSELDEIIDEGAEDDNDCEVSVSSLDIGEKIQEAQAAREADEEVISYLDLTAVRTGIGSRLKQGRKKTRSAIPQGKSIDELTAVIEQVPASVEERTRDARRAREFEKLSCIFHKRDPESSSSNLPLAPPEDN